MEKAKHSTYHSDSVLGKLYDMVKKEGFDNRENYKLPFDERILKRYQLDHAVMKAARRIKTQYDISMRRVMGQLEIRTEFEVWATFVMTRPRVGTDYKTQEKVGREAAGLKKQFRDTCLKEVEEKSFQRLEFVAAMYKVTWEETQIALHEARQQHVLPDGTVGLRRVTARSMPLISFPWLFPDELGRIALNTERLPNLAELGISLPATKPKAKAGGKGGVQLETALDLEGMDYTKTSDGQYIHRGEILHLFRHNDDDDEGIFANEDAAESGAETASEEEQNLDQSSPAKDNGPGDFLTLLDLDAALDASTTDAASPIHQETTTGDATVLSPGTAADLDLLSFDMDMAADPSPCLTPTRVYPQQDAPPSVADSTSEMSTSISHVVNGEAASDITNNNKPDTESVISDSNDSSWDRVTSARSDSPPVVVVHEPPVEEGRGSATSGRVASPVVELVDRPLEGGCEPVVRDLDPVEYITLSGYGGLGMGWGLGVGRPRLTAAELWGSGSSKEGEGSGLGGGGGSGGGGYGQGQGQGQGKSQVQDQGQGRVQSPGHGLGQNQNQSKNRSTEHDQSQGQDQGRGQGQSQSPNQTLSWDQKWVGFASGKSELAAPVKEGETASSESDEEMEYEEDVVEVVGETALERAARFG
jgi:RNA-dependent RNA polymerase